MDFLYSPAASSRSRARRARRDRRLPEPAGRAPASSSLAVRIVELGRHLLPDNVASDPVRGNGPGIVLLLQGGGKLVSGSSSLAVAGPALALLTEWRDRVHLEAGARGYMVMLENAAARRMCAREPAFDALFNRPGVVTLAAADESLRNLEATVAAMALELRRAAAARLTAVEAHLQLFLTGVLRALEPASPCGAQTEDRIAARPAQLVAEFLRLADTHCRDRWRLRDYARALRVSPGYLRAICARVAGASPVQLIHESLLREAQHRLIATSLPIAAIAHELGFEDAAYFSRLFHAKIGTSPRQYRLAFGQRPPANPPITTQ